MGSGDHKSFLNFHIHFNHHHHHHDHHHHHQEDQMNNKKDHIPKGCLAIKVGHEGEEQQRFVIPLIYIYHPLFMQLLKEAEEEYGFVYQEGPINIPCHVDEFRNLQCLIDQDKENNYHHHRHHHHHHHHVWCFKA